MKDVKYSPMAQCCFTLFPAEWTWMPIRLSKTSFLLSYPRHPWRNTAKNSCPRIDKDANSERTRTSVVLIRSKIFVRKTCRWAMYKDVHCSTALGIAAIAFLPLRHRRRSLWSVCGITLPGLLQTRQKATSVKPDGCIFNSHPWIHGCWICVNRNALFFKFLTSSLFTAYYSLFAAQMS